MPKDLNSEMGGERFLIVNADDLGLSPGVNAGIVRAHEDGIVTSASLMVRQPAAHEAASIAAAHPGLAIGIHLDLGQWDFEDGEWVAAYLRCDQSERAAVEAECRAQLAAFREILGRDPTHVDSHQHVHEVEPVASAAATIAAELGVPLRGRQIRYEGSFYGQTGRGEPVPGALAPARMIALIRSLPSGWTELGCHPGLGVETESSYAHERELELRTLCDPSVSAALAAEKVYLRSFSDFTTPSS
ncbi:MAG TPA: ChbG/HpnK family deacetylase [Solirubrobacterales bacterium]|nr:ChbG/HpnK family deacetylase [Solirubrobacterales bacterium]